MPELPEAETIVRDLRARVRGAIVRAVSVPRPDILAQGLTAARLGRTLRGRRIENVTRRAKTVVLEFQDGWRLAIGLGMTGRVLTSDAPAAAQLAHIAARIELADGRALLYDDSRRFGRLDLRDAARWSERSAELGVEPLSDAFTRERMHALTRLSASPVRNFLLDQKRIAGIGNIYASEALHRAGVRPTRRTRSLTRAESAALHQAIRDVLQEAVRARGTTLNDYRDAGGEPGGFQVRLRVYDRAGLPCPVCGTPIKRVVRSNRSAFYCPRCQR
jgi:formamidopyrimidine-DNA glycosylase